MSLSCHPETPSSAVKRIEVEVARSGPGSLMLRYGLFGDMAGVRFPEPVEAEQAGRADGLWRHTCFEAFIRTTEVEGYLELNFAPWHQWATYRFSGYRADMAAASVEPWSMHGGKHPDHMDMEILVDPGTLGRPDLPIPLWQIGLSAVIEDIDGGISYWALAHAPGKPDFHHPDSFVLTLPPPEPV